MESGELFITSRDGVYMVRVTGRATVECAPGLRNLAKNLQVETFKGIRIDLKDCSWMDSTFMGILAMLGLRAKKINAPMTILNAGKQNTDLLCGLGLKKLFVFEDAAPAESGDSWQSTSAAQGNTKLETTRMVLDAHETLMDVDTGNVQKFGSVVSFVKQDLEKQEKADKQ